MTKKNALQYFICSLNFKSHNFQTESPFKHVAPTYRWSTTLSFCSPCYTLCLGHFEFKTLLTSSSAFSKRPKYFCTKPSNRSYVRNRHKPAFFLGPRFFCILQIFKLPFKQLGSYKFHQSLLSRNSCLVPDSGSMPKWVPPQVSWWVDGCRVWERAAEQPATHSIRTCGWHCHAQGRTSSFQGQASRQVQPQYAHLLPWKQ